MLFRSPLAILWNSAFKWVYLSFSPLPFASLLFSAICKASPDNCFTYGSVYMSIPISQFIPHHWAVYCRELSSVLCDDLEGWDGEGGRETPEGGDKYIYIYIYMASLVAQLVKNPFAIQETLV